MSYSPRAGDIWMSTKPWIASQGETLILLDIVKKTVTVPENEDREEEKWMWRILVTWTGKRPGLRFYHKEVEKVMGWSPTENFFFLGRSRDGQG